MGRRTGNLQVQQGGGGYFKDKEKGLRSNVSEKKVKS